MTTLVTRGRLLELLRGYISDNSGEKFRPDFNFEDHVLNVMQLAADEAVAQTGLREASKYKLFCYMTDAQEVVHDMFKDDPDVFPVYRLPRDFTG